MFGWVREEKKEKVYSCVQSNSFYKSLRITDIVSETPSAKSFVLQALEGWQPQYRSGQFITLVFKTRHGEKRRSYSISSSPELNEPLRITVKKIDNGEFSRLLNYHAKVGDVLLSSGISGFFVLPELQEAEQFFFPAAGSGITPCLPMIKTLLQKTGKKVCLIYSNKTEADSIFINELKQLQNRYAQRFQLRLLFSTIRNVYQSRLSNWLLPQLVNELLQVQRTACRFYLCGPFEYMQMAEITLLSDFPKKNILKESFVHWPRLILPEPPDRKAHQVNVCFNSETFHLTVQYPVSVLAEAKKQDIQLPYSCEAGRCGSCVASVTKGKAWMAYNEVLTDSEVNKGRILVCQAYPVGGDLDIEF